MILVFNPWMGRDTTYMPVEDEKAEWLLNEEGTLFTGSAWYVQTKAWVYDQFDPEIVAIVFDLLLSSLPRGELSDPVLLSRRMSSMCNGNDNGGLMIGNWSGKYTPFVAPTKWTNSLDVFRKWKESGPVKYGQCFTFAAVLTTVMRCVGVPCRPVSNYWSAHDGGFDRNI